MKILQRYLILISLLSLSVSAETENTDSDILLVVVSQSSGIETLTKNEVIDIFMGRYVTFPNGQRAQAYDQPARSVVKGLFYRKLVNRSEAQINTYWARLLFSGRSSPPQSANSAEEVVVWIKDSTEGIAYISSQDLTDSLKVVYRFEAF